MADSTGPSSKASSIQGDGIPSSAVRAKKAAKRAKKKAQARQNGQHQQEDREGKDGSTITVEDDGNEQSMSAQSPAPPPRKKQKKAKMPKHIKRGMQENGLSNEDVDESGIFFIDTAPAEQPAATEADVVAQDNDTVVPAYVGLEAKADQAEVVQGSSKDHEQKAPVNAVIQADNAGETDDVGEVSSSGSSGSKGNGSGEDMDIEDEGRDSADAIDDALDLDLDISSADGEEAESSFRKPPPLRYFKEENPAGQDDAVALPACQRCGGTGHSVRNCDHLQCATCGKLDDHPTRHCPLTMTCFRCGQKGHQSRDCTESHVVSRSCDRCFSRLHISTLCPLIWRDYIRASNAPTSKKATPKIVYACYNCASGGHFGDDCPRPRAHPLKYVDASAFTMREVGEVGDHARPPPPPSASSRPHTPVPSTSSSAPPRLKPTMSSSQQAFEYKPPKNAPSAPKGMHARGRPSLHEQLQSNSHEEGEIEDDEEEEEEFLSNIAANRGRAGGRGGRGGSIRGGRGSGHSRSEAPYQPFKGKNKGDSVRSRSRSPPGRREIPASGREKLLNESRRGNGGGRGKDRERDRDPLDPRPDTSRDGGYRASNRKELIDGYSNGSGRSRGGDLMERIEGFSDSERGDGGGRGGGKAKRGGYRGGKFRGGRYKGSYF